MARKKGFLLIELLVSLFVFIIFASFFSYFIYISLQTKRLAISRLENLNSAINEIEKIKAGISSRKSKHGQDANSYSIKISKELENFMFIKIKKQFSSLLKRNHEIILIGPGR